MTIRITPIAALAVMLCGLAACMNNSSPTSLPPGRYDKTTVSTDQNGTTTENTTSTDVDVDEYGNKKAVVQTKTTKDPKGLFNKTTTRKTKQVIDER